MNVQIVYAYYNRHDYEMQDIFPTEESFYIYESTTVVDDPDAIEAELARIIGELSPEYEFVGYELNR